jgi:hypothetical protein
MKVPADIAKTGGLLDSYATDQQAIAQFGEDPTKMRTSLSNAQQWLNQGIHSGNYMVDGSGSLG